MITLLLPGVQPSALNLWFDEEPVAVPVELKVGGVSEALPQILAALGEQLPDDVIKQQPIATRSTAELLLELSDPAIHTEAGTRHGHGDLDLHATRLSRCTTG